MFDIFCLQSINDLFGPREYKSTPPKLVVSYKCKKEDLTELITQVLTENAYIISVIKPMVKQLHTKTSLHDVYKGLEENINIIIDLDKRFADITLNTIFQHISVLTNNMLNCMNLKESLRICLDEQDPRISHICWNCEGYINHLQVLISLLSSAVMKPLVFCKSEPFMLTERPPRQVIKAIQKRPYYRGKLI